MCPSALTSSSDAERKPMGTGIAAPPLSGTWYGWQPATSSGRPAFDSPASPYSVQKTCLPSEASRENVWTSLVSGVQCRTGGADVCAPLETIAARLAAANAAGNAAIHQRQRRGGFTAATARAGAAAGDGAGSAATHPRQRRGRFTAATGRGCAADSASPYTCPGKRYPRRTTV